MTEWIKNKLNKIQCKPPHIKYLEDENINLPI